MKKVAAISGISRSLRSFLTIFPAAPDAVSLVYTKGEKEPVGL